jgi:hypothetical protein
LFTHTAPFSGEPPEKRGGGGRGGKNIGGKNKIGRYTISPEFFMRRERSELIV